tara:strand:+ start:383 stop:1114 length:732 start_codon:yes stop_codon:yes gene_type:complete
MNKDKIIDNIKTIIFALIVAIVIRTFLFQPFYIPSASMEPNLLIGDRLFVTKYSYGYSKHSFPFSIPLIKEKIFKQIPKRGDVIVFKTPYDNRTDYIKRLIGLPGDTIQFVDGNLFINNSEIIKTKIKKNYKISCGNEILDVDAFKEKMPNGIEYIAVYKKEGSILNTSQYIVPENHYFFMGDNRDCSKDSRFLSSVGYVNDVNLVGKARILFFSNDKSKGSFFNIFKWQDSIRYDRFLKKIR